MNRPLWIGVRPLSPDEIARAFEGHDHIAAQRALRIHPPINWRTVFAWIGLVVLVGASLAVIR